MADETIKDEIFDQPKSLLDEFKQRAQNMDRTVEKGFVNEQTGSSMGIRDNGDIVIAANKESQYKLNHNTGAATEISYQSNTVTNRKNIVADEIVVNNHKLNPQLYELSDMKEILNDPNKAMGDLTMLGTVLVKAWDANLNKYMLIRRQVRIPIFSKSLNPPDAPAMFGLDTNVTDELNKVEEGQ
jgi:hypothetical protein